MEKMSMCIYLENAATTQIIISLTLGFSSTDDGFLVY